MRKPIFSILLAQNSYDRARDSLGKIGEKTGLGTIQPGGQQVDIYGRIANYLNAILGLVGILASIYIIYAGIKWMRAGGNEEDIKAAKQTLRNAIIGLVVIFGSYAIVNFVILRLIETVKQ